MTIGKMMTTQKQTKSADYIKVRQIGSPIGRDSSQRATLIGLGLNKIGREVRLESNPSTLGMIKKVLHLLSVEKA